MAENIPITNMSPGLHADVDARLVPSGACVRGQNTRHHLGTIRVREGRKVQLALPDGMVSPAKLLAEYRTLATPLSRLLLVAGDALYGTPDADADGWHQVGGVDTPLLTGTDLFNGSNPVQAAGYKDFEYFVDGKNNVLKWTWGDPTPIRLTDLPKPTYAPQIAIVNTPVKLDNTLAGETWSTMTTFMPTPVYPTPVDPYYSYGTEPYGYGTTAGSVNYDNNGILVRPFSVDDTGHAWADGLSHNGLELVTTDGIYPLNGVFRSMGWMEIEYPFHRTTGKCLDLSNSDQIHIQFYLGGKDTPDTGDLNNSFPSIYLQLGSHALGDLAHDIPVSYTGAYGSVIDAYVSLAGISQTDLSSVQFIAIKVDANGGGCPIARFDTAGYAGEPSGQSLSGYSLAMTFVLLKLQSNSLTSNFIAGNQYNVYTTFLYVDPHDSTKTLESDVSPVASVTLLSDTYLNPSGMSVAQGILPGSNSSTSPPTPCNCAPYTPTPPIGPAAPPTNQQRDLSALEYNGALPTGIYIYANGGEWGQIEKLVGYIPITDSGTWATQPLEIDETLATDLDGTSVYTTLDGRIGPEITPYQAAPPKGTSLIIEWQGRMIYGAQDSIYVSAWDNPDLIAPVAITASLGTTYGFSDPVGMDGFPLTGFGLLGTYLIILKNRSKWLLTGSDASTFDLQLIPGDEGCSSPKSVRAVPGAGLIWRDGTHVWLMGGDFIPHDIGKSINTLLDNDTAGDTFSYYDPIELVYVMTVPAHDGIPTTAYAFEMRSQSWDTPWFNQPGGCAARMELLTTAGTYAADIALTGDVTRLLEGLDDDGEPIGWQWVSAAITGPVQDRQKDVRQLVCSCSFVDPIPPDVTPRVTLSLYANGALHAYAQKTLPADVAPNTTGQVKWSPPPCSNVLDMQAGVSGASTIGGEIVEVAFYAEVKGVR